MTNQTSRHNPPPDRIPNPRPDTHPSTTDLSTTDIAGVVEALTGQRILSRPGAENDPRIR
ncbi:MAG: hypothetical protein WAW17_20100 [Rhodococcus sp. (in: high G+C Gram-positive bacteria)]|uniref:hypothetical protein n=1 Tax=Rhodococcus sp. TaxID=1831 RepID=UPI003BB0760E